MRGSRRIAAGLLLLAGWCLAGNPAFAEKRVALIIGNSAYEKVARLGNPANDASLMAETLRKAGFNDIDLRRDLTVVDMRRALRDFVERASDADVAVVYFAGHGIEIDGVNYLVPIDAVLDRDRDIYDEGLSLDRVMVAVDPARKLRLVILDACRDNPFSRTMKRTVASRAIGRGLAKVEPTTANTLIAFASKAGSTASDGEGGNSPFTAALVSHITKPGLDLRRAFGYVRDDVLRSTNNRQEPYLYGSLGGDEVALVSATPQPDAQSAARRDFELAVQFESRGVWETFLRKYPDGLTAEVARARLKKIDEEETRIATVEKARLAEEERVRLLAESTKRAEIAEAAASARIAADNRIEAEKAKHIAEEKAEIARLAEQEKARILAERAKLAVQENEAAIEQARRAAQEMKQLAALIPQDRQEAHDIDLPRALQTELQRVGCSSIRPDGNWSASSQRALNLFNRHAGTKFEVETASPNALDAIKQITGRICPLVCDQGFRADGERCVKINCRSGSFINNDNECEKKRPSARRAETQSKEPLRPSIAAQTASPTMPLYKLNRCQTSGGAIMEGRPCN